MLLLDRVSHRLKFRDLTLLDAVVRWKSMAKAATHLHVSQPAVSKAIAELEHMLGARLLDRGSRGIEPTPYARALLKRGTAIFDELRQGLSEIEFLSDPKAGEVRIATSEPMAAGLLPIIIGRLSRKNPGVSVFVTQSPIGSLQFRTPRYQELHERNVDLVLGPVIKPFDEGDLEVEHLFNDPLVVAAGIRNRWTRRRSVTLAELIDEPWCTLPVDTLVGARGAEAFRASSLNAPRRSVVSISVQLQIGLLATQPFLTILPKSLVYFSGNRFSIKRLPVELPIAPVPVGIITLRNRTISPAAQLFIRMAREVAQQVASSK
jgi:DNA-binding transcriptional LysR family regulator